MCGNPVAALRQRKRQKPTVECKTPDNKTDSGKPIVANKCKSWTSFKPEHSYLTTEEIKKDSKEDIFEELKKWRLKNQSYVIISLYYYC